jgi:VWFA-related protein
VQSRTGVIRVTQGALGIFLSLFLFMGSAAAQQQVPNAPLPQAPSGSNQAGNLNQLTDQMAPGKGTQPLPQQTAPSTSAASQSQGPVGNEPQKTPPQMPAPGQQAYKMVVPVTYVNVPVTVLDKHGHPVAGLTWRQFRVYEDGVRQHIAFFTSDAYPMSIAFVIDQTLPSDVMKKVNHALSAVEGALAPYDSMAVVTYDGTGPKLITTFTAAHSERLTAALKDSQRSGERMGVPSMSGPMMAGPTINGQQVDPNLAPQRGNSGFLVMPRSAHPLNDAILYAANLLSQQPKGRKRIIYVISDGKDVRSQASYKQVVRFLLTNNISVYGTLVGDASIWGVGFLDKVHLPLLPPEDVLPKYAVATGGQVDAEFNENAIQESFARIAASIRTQYTLMYASHTPLLSEKFRTIDVRVEGIPGLTILAKRGYYPSANMGQ